MNFGEIFGKSWNEYWKNFGSFLKFMFIYYGLPSLILSVIVTSYVLSNSSVWDILTNQDLSKQLSIGQFFGELSSYFILLGVSLLISIFLYIYVTKGIITASLKKDKYSSSDLVSGGKNNYWSFVGFSVVSFIFILLLLLLLIIPGIIFAIFWIFAAYVFVNQNKGIIESLRTSFHMVKGRWWQTVGYLAVVALVGAGVSVIVSLLSLPVTIISAIGQAAGAGISKPLFAISALIEWVTTFLAYLFTIPFTAVFFKNYYLSLKGRLNKK